MVMTFAMLGLKKEVGWCWEDISTKIESKHRCRLGPAHSDLEEVRILNRIVTRRMLGSFMRQISLGEVGLEECSRTISTPIRWSSKDPTNRNGVVNSAFVSKILYGGQEGYE